jgi:hypothetical protein
MTEEYVSTTKDGRLNMSLPKVLHKHLKYVSGNFRGFRILRFSLTPNLFCAGRPQRVFPKTKRVWRSRTSLHKMCG